MNAIHPITGVESKVHGVSEKLKGKQEVTSIKIRDVLEGYEDVRDYIQVSINMPWDKVCNSANAHNPKKLIEVLDRALKRRNEDGRTDMGVDR